MNPSHRSPLIATRQIDLPVQIDRLRLLGTDFTALHTTVTELDPQQGAEALQQIGLTGRASAAPAKAPNAEPDGRRR